MNCYYCGAELNKNDYYCPKCRRLNQPGKADSGKQEGSLSQRVVENMKEHWISCLIALGMAVIFFFDWYSLSFLFFSFNGNITQLYDSFGGLIEMVGLEGNWSTAMTWGTRAFYLIPISQAVYILVAFFWRRFSVLAGMISAWLTFAMSAAYVAALIFANGAISERLGSALLDYKAAPICLVVLSLINGILLIRLSRKRKKDRERRSEPVKTGRAKPTKAKAGK